MNSTSQQNKSESTQTNPWAPQSGYLNQAFSGAAGALSQASGAPRPDQFVSQFTPDQLQLFQNMVSAGSDGNIPGSSANAGYALTGAGTGALTSGFAGLQGYKPTGMSSILSDANMAANDPSVQGRIDASLRDARRSVSEGVLPQIGRSAALSGNTNGSRTGIAEGIVQRGLADTTADTSANIRGQAYSEGLSTALQRAMTGDSNSLDAIKSLVSGGTNAVTAGVNANTGAVAQRGGLFDIANQGVQGQQAAAQAPINDALARYQFGTSSPFDALNSFYNIIGANNWGGSSTGTSTTTSTPSTWDTIGKLMSAGGAFMPTKK